MTDIESPLGKSSFPGNPQQGRMLTVDDPTAGGVSPQHNLNIRPEHFRQQDQDQPQQAPLRQLTPDEIAGYEQARAQAHRSQDIVDKTSRERIEYLSGIGRIKTDFEMDGVVFKLQSLKDGQLEDVLDVMLTMTELPQTKFNFALRRQTLARALAAVDNMPIRDIIGSDDVESKLEFLRELDENLINMMYKHYEENVLKVSKDKYAIKTEEDVVEVVEAVKK